MINILSAMFALPFNPLAEFSRYDQNGWNKWTSRFVLWSWLLIYGFTYAYLNPNTGHIEIWLLVGAAVLLKMVGIGFFFMSTAVGWAICQVDRLSGRAMLVMVSFTMLPNCLELFAYFQFPDYAFYAMAVLVLWRIVIMVFGMYVIADLTMKQAIIVSVISFWFLYPWDFILWLI